MWGQYGTLTRLIDVGGETLTFALNSGFHFGSADVLWPSCSEANEASRNMYRKVLMRYDRDKLLIDINVRQNPEEPSCQTTPLVMASAWDDKSVVEQLIKHGALINLEGAREGTPLMAGCTYGRLSVVKALVRLGAILVHSKNGTVLSAVYAARHFPPIVRWLIVERFCEQRLLPTFSPSALAEIYPSIEVRKLNLDLIFMEAWEDYVNTKIIPPSNRRFIGRMEADAGFIEETAA